MRISDWSSDVCSSDLRAAALPRHAGERTQAADRGCAGDGGPGLAPEALPGRALGRAAAARGDRACARRQPAPAAGRRAHRQPRLADRSEEHTSELQSLMRISYAVFCLKKKTIKRQNKPAT